MNKFLMTTVYLLVIAFVLSGCAVIVPEYDKYGQLVKVSSSKFLADLTYEQSIKWDPVTGRCIERTIRMETKTNADRILGEVVKGAGVLVDGAGKVMP